ncbi:MAG: alpha/beta hydrolase [Ruminococcus flavefaciens]|nr:alpha/beta hydrolase [Ruminococcus flavefaciens]
MGRKYDAALLEALKLGQQGMVKDEVPVLVKPIPEGGADGDMDPRLAKSLRFMPLMARFMPKPKAGATVAEQIAMPRKMFGEYKGDYVVTEGVDTKQAAVESADGYPVPVYIYKRTDAGRELPVLVYYHGGGFFGGGTHIVEQMCKVLVRELDCIVLNVDYRLCPEAHYPQPLDDCWAATRWAFEHAEELGAARKKLAVSGDSAGGNLAAAVTLRDREEGTGMVGLQALIYPAVNIAGAQTEFYRGADPAKYHKSKRHAKYVDAMYQMMNAMAGGGGNMLDDVYLQGHERPEHIYASPILDDFHALPPTLLAFGEHDFLAFEDFAYARHAVKAGVELKTIVYRGLGHGFADQIGVMPQGEDLMSEIAVMMKEVL